MTLEKTSEWWKKEWSRNLKKNIHIKKEIFVDSFGNKYIVEKKYNKKKNDN